MYDHPPSPRASVVALHASTKLHRSHSPIPHISTLLPHHHHSQYTPNSRQSDVSRLLDPAYASSSSSASTSGVYVDHRGDLHDPDYRDFPTYQRVTSSHKQRIQRRSMSATPSSYHSQQQSKTARRQSSSSSALSDRYSTYPLVARPDWEQNWVQEDVDEYEDLDELDSQDVHSPFSSSSASSSSSPTTSRRASMPASTFFFSEPQTISPSSSPIGSLEEQDEEHEQSPFEDDESASTKMRRRAVAAGLLKRMKRSSSVDRVEEHNHLSECNEQEEEEAFPNDPEEHKHDDVPSCTYALRQQWQALSLRLRFGVFHVKRRLRRKTI